MKVVNKVPQGVHTQTDNKKAMGLDSKAKLPSDEYLEGFCIILLRSLLGALNNRKSPTVEYGTSRGLKARRCLKDGSVHFVMWHKGEQGHKEDCWMPLDKSWWSTFKPDLDSPVT